MELNSILNFLDDGIQKNNERLADLQNFLEQNPSKSIQRKKNKNNIYYYFMFRKNSKVKRIYLGCKNKIDIKKEQKKLNDYNKRIQQAKARYQLLKSRNEKLKKVFDVALKVSNES